MSTLSNTQINEFARDLANIKQHIEKFFDNPQNEQAFQEWYFKKYGHKEGEPVYEQN